ncbi:unnamed protein product [Calypogeia fissa]
MASLQQLPLAIAGIQTPSFSSHQSSSASRGEVAACLKTTRNSLQLGQSSSPGTGFPGSSSKPIPKQVIPARKFSKNVAARASKCPFGFQGPPRRDGKESSTTEAASTVIQSPLPISAPYAPAPSSSPEARNIGPGTFEYLPLKIPYKMVMGVEPLDPEDWIEIDIFYDEEVALRRDVLETRKEISVASHPAYPQAVEANWEVLELLVEFLPKRFPSRFAVTGGGNVIHNLSSGEVFDISDRSQDPLDISSRLVQEDLCLMMKVDGELRFVSGAVLFPQRWSLQEKLGMNMKDIHLPVPLYEEIGPKVNAFMDRLKVGKPVWRANWTIVDDPTLFQPMTEEDIYGALQGRIRELDDQITVSTAGTRLFTRCERETLMRLPRTGAILFTIRTYIKPLSVFEPRPALAAKMVQGLRAFPEPISKYKTMASYYHLALEYLQQCAKV